MSSDSEKNLLKCPQCEATAFYIEKDDAMVFLRINVDGSPILSDATETNIQDLGLSEIYCTACAWHGTIDELKS